MKGLIKIFILLFVCINLTSCLKTTGTTEVGIKVNKMVIVGKSGVQEEIYAPGSSYLILPFFQEWYTLDTRVQNLEMTASALRGDRQGDDQLRFKTIDGNDIGLDVIISYRIIPEKAHLIIQNVALNDVALKENLVRTVARSVTRDVFGELRTEEFYIAEVRERKADQAKAALNGAMNPFGVMVENVSTKDYRFNAEYQQAIEDRKVADQLAERYKSETQAATEEYLKKVEQAKGQVNEMVAHSDGEYQRTRIESDAYFEQQTKRAEATRAEAEAEAKGITEMNKALASQGGEVMVKLRIADALQKKKIMLLPSGSNTLDLKSTNLNQLLQVFGTEKIAEKARE
ncbi:MAG: prohibitin family protein [Proteobacteria bacterium]|nr:prohibitin family protein [Pseudomonadota bacterium]